ncbi:hypothetical protein A3Q56_06782 [Intoshia linei]|uniref:Uncharacterized protein n=1 Tax=Intoshia linei TaxID=1819745 RepID=A0A177AVE9_9BILA|nr:hypothetical protein A3Q56_06782 [Intoshia linei]
MVYRTLQVMSSGKAVSADHIFTDLFNLLEKDIYFANDKYCYNSLLPYFDTSTNERQKCSNALKAGDESLFPPNIADCAGKGKRDNTYFTLVDLFPFLTERIVDFAYRYGSNKKNLINSKSLRSGKYPKMQNILFIWNSRSDDIYNTNKTCGPKEQWKNNCSTNNLSFKLQEIDRPRYRHHDAKPTMIEKLAHYELCCGYNHTEKKG